MDLTTARDCADRWGTSESYARRVLATVDHVDRDPDTGAKRYDRAEADAARGSLPGRGRRFDLHSPKVMSREDVERLTADDSIPPAHRALWALMQEGVRVGDALSLDVRDVNIEDGAVQVDVPAKGPGPKRYPLSDEAAALAREAIADRTEGPLLANEDGRALTRYNVSRFAQAVAGVASIHAFRPPPWERVQAKALKVGDCVRVGEMKGVVDRPLVHVRDASGADFVEVTFEGTVGPVKWEADMWVTIDTPPRSIEG